MVVVFSCVQSCLCTEGLHVLDLMGENMDATMDTYLNERPPEIIFMHADLQVEWTQLKGAFMFWIVIYFRPHASLWRPMTSYLSTPALSKALPTLLLSSGSVRSGHDHGPQRLLAHAHALVFALHR